MLVKFPVIMEYACFDLLQINGGNLGGNFDLGFVDHSGQDTGVNHEIIRTPLLNSHASLRLQTMVSFLTNNLPIFAASCLAITPPSILHLPSPSSSDPVSEDAPLVIPTVTYPANSYTVPLICEPTGQAAQGRSLEKLVTGADETELCFQWYQPSYDDITVVEGGGSGEKGRGVYLLYALSQLPAKGSTKTKKSKSLKRA